MAPSPAPKSRRAAALDDSLGEIALDLDENKQPESEVATFALS